MRTAVLLVTAILTVVKTVTPVALRDAVLVCTCKLILFTCCKKQHIHHTQPVFHQQVHSPLSDMQALKCSGLNNITSNVLITKISINSKITCTCFIINLNKMNCQPHCTLFTLYHYQTICIYNI